MNFLWVALGGSVGAMARYALALTPVKTSFPILTLVTNILGALMIGVVVGIAEQKRASPEAFLFWKTGVCGGFTTFSTFSLEALKLFEKESYFAGGLYVVLSVVCCVVGVFCGRKLALAVL